MEIPTQKQQKVYFNKRVIMLGTFHTCMIFYGSMDYIMADSVIQCLLELTYAEYSVPQIFLGKAFARATRAFLITAGVSSCNVHNINFDLNVDDESFVLKFHEALNEREELSKFAKIMDEIIAKKIVSNDLTMLYDHIISIQEKLEHSKENLHENKTAKSWLIYIKMVTILCKFTNTQRRGNWFLDLEAISE